MNKIKPLAFVMDSSVMKDIINKNNKTKSLDLLEKFKEMKKIKGESNLHTSISSLLRAIYLADPKVPIKNLQELMDELKIMPNMFTDYKNEKVVIDEIILLAKVLSGDKFKEEKNEK